MVYSLESLSQHSISGTPFRRRNLAVRNSRRYLTRGEKVEKAENNCLFGVRWYLLYKLQHGFHKITEIIQMFRADYFHNFPINFIILMDGDISKTDGAS
jgi:hypothetical protein